MCDHRVICAHWEVAPPTSLRFDASVNKMSTSSTSVPPLARVITPIIFVLAVGAIIGGSLTLLGWGLYIPRFTDWANHGISMFPNAAVCSIACGMAILLLHFSRGSVRWMSVAFAVLAAAIGGMSLFQHITGVNLGIDEFLFKGDWGQAAATSPMRIGPPASVSFLILGTALILAAFGSRFRRVASVLAVFPVAVASLSLVGYWFGANQLFGIGRYTGIAWQTAVLIASLAVATMFTLREQGFVALLLRQDAGGLVARRLVIPIVAIPLFLGWLRTMGQALGLYDYALGTSLRTLVEICLFLGFLWWTANSIAEHAARARAASTALSEIEERFSRFMKYLPGMAWIKDLQGRYVYVNDATVNAVGIPREQFIGRKDSDFLPSDVAEQLVSNDHLAVDHPGGLEVIESFKHANGEERSSLVNKFSMPGPDGTPLWVGGIAIDISDRLRAERDLREAHQRKDEFLATLAHELRNPLAPIRYSVHLCRTDADATERKWALDVVDRQVQQMARLLDDLLDVSRISYGKLTLRSESMLLSDIIDRAIETSQPLRDAAEQKIDIELPAQPVHLMGDPVRLEQVFANLLNNAAKYGGKNSQVWLKGTIEDSVVQVSIRDNGAGIPPDRLSDIFEIFSQVRDGKNPTQGGLGIGLSLVRGLVELHGGSIAAHSDGAGKGSEFTIRLPVREGTGDVEKTPTTKAIADDKRLRLLIADDLKDSADSVAAFFRAKGYDVRTAYDGEQAWAVAAEFLPEAVFLDVGMPGLDGPQVCRRIRAQAWGNGALIVAITGWGQKSDRERTSDAGFDHHLVKPVEIEELMALLRAHNNKS